MDSLHFDQNANIRCRISCCFVAKRTSVEDIDELSLTLCFYLFLYFSFAEKRFEYSHRITLESHNIDVNIDVNVNDTEWKTANTKSIFNDLRKNNSYFSIDNSDELTNEKRKYDYQQIDWCSMVSKENQKKKI